MEETVKTETNTEQTPPATQETVPQQSPPVLKKKSKLPLIIVLLVLLMIGGAVYFLFLDTPGKVKEKVKVAHPVFLSYTRYVEKMAEHLEEEAESDSDSIERYGAKGEDILKDVRNEKEKLTTELNDMKSGKLQKYKDALQAYLSKSDEVYDLEEDNVAFSKAYVEPLRTYEKLSIDVSGASSYLYSDPDKYVDILRQAIEDEQSVIRDLQKLKLDGDMGRMHEVFIETLQTEVTFLEEMVDAVENRDNSEIATSTQRYTQAQQNNGKELQRVSDKLDNVVEDINDELETLKDKAEDQYNELKEEYNI